VVNVKMKVLCLLALLGLAFADPTAYFQESFDGK